MAFLYTLLFKFPGARVPTRPRFQLCDGKILALSLCSWAGAGDSGNEGADGLLNNLARGQTTAAERV